jgi:hypothetical protein
MSGRAPATTQYLIDEARLAFHQPGDLTPRAAAVKAIKAADMDYNLLAAKRFFERHLAEITASLD